MNTPRLDQEINGMKWLEKEDELSIFGKEKLTELIAIKKALNIDDVSNQRELLIAFTFKVAEQMIEEPDFNVNEFVENYIKSN